VFKVGFSGLTCGNNPAGQTARELLDLLAANALHTAKANAERITGDGGHYILIVKGGPAEAPRPGGSDGRIDYLLVIPRDQLGDRQLVVTAGLGVSVPIPFLVVPPPGGAPGRRPRQRPPRSDPVTPWRVRCVCLSHWTCRGDALGGAGCPPRLSQRARRNRKISAVPP
jgi:hypothetical protein